MAGGVVCGSVRGVLLLSVFILAAPLGGCSYFRGEGGGWRVSQHEMGPTVDGLLVDREIRGRLDSDDRDRLESVTAEALETPPGESRLEWEAPGGARGVVEAGPVFIDGVENTRGAPLLAPLNLHTDTALTPKQEDYVTKVRTNVRLGPSTDDDKVDRLEPGTRVRAVGATPADDWLLVAQDAKVIGYMFASLLQPTGHSELMLAGGQPRLPRICRLFRQSLTFAEGDTATWRGVACRMDFQRWRVDPELSTS